MRIAIDARALEEQQGTGVARYLRNILAVWNNAARSDIEVVCYTRQPVDESTRWPRLGWQVVAGGVMGRRGLIWQNTRLLRAVRRDRADVLWCPFNLAPLTAPCPIVVTIHDVSFVADPGGFRPYERVVWGNLARISAHRAVQILTVSDFSRMEIVRYLRVDPGRVTAAPEAADPTLREVGADGVAVLRQRLDLQRPYALFVGAMFARRHTVELLDAYEQVRDRLPQWQLVLVGPNRYSPRLDLTNEITKRGLTSDVRHIPYIEEADLAALYSGASCFVYPSSYEGFGLPVLEAMACGVPVITGDAISLREVAGEASIVVDPRSARLLAAGLVLVGSQQRLRDELRRRGFEQAARFDWQQTARITLETLQSAVRRA
ncbi:MAG: glycosyltransferase family 1 protein [Herpetosiphon sp.]